MLIYLLNIAFHGDQSILAKLERTLRLCNIPTRFGRYFHILQVAKI